MIRIVALMLHLFGSSWSQVKILLSRQQEIISIFHNGIFVFYYGLTHILIIVVIFGVKGLTCNNVADRNIKLDHFIIFFLKILGIYHLAEIISRKE